MVRAFDTNLSFIFNRNLIYFLRIYNSNYGNTLLKYFNSKLITNQCDDVYKIRDVHERPFLVKNLLNKINEENIYYINTVDT